jgi:hypothetical protein
MLGIAWHEHNGMEVSVRQLSRTCNFTAVINRLTIGYREVGTRRYKIVEVDNGTTRAPYKAVALEFACTIA